MFLHLEWRVRLSRVKPASAVSWIPSVSWRDMCFGCSAFERSCCLRRKSIMKSLVCHCFVKQNEEAESVPLLCATMSPKVLQGHLPLSAQCMLSLAVAAGNQHKPQTGESQTMEGVWMREREKGIGKNHVHMWGKIIQQGNHPAREHTFRDINDTRQNHPVWGKNPRWQTCIRENHPAKASSRKTQTGRRMKCRLHRAAKSSDQGCPRNLAQPSSSSRPKHEPNYTSIDPK